MVDLLEIASSWLNDQRRLFMSRPVVYSRGGNSVTVLASVGRPKSQTESETDVFESFEAQDFIIRTADLVLGGVLVTPLPGDQINVTQGSQTFVYEIMAEQGEPCWRWSDPYRNAMRVHTKQVGGI